MKNITNLKGRFEMPGTVSASVDGATIPPRGSGTGVSRSSALRRGPGLLLTLAGLIMLSACGHFKPPPAGIGEPTDWSEVAGWHSDRHADSWPALKRNCR
ncbi:MAG: hypothetical protein F4093_04110, partial [Gammaproteobacteria bacterium]|nr:hypothetical protein [Gammaproteobacteria bacterium]